MWREGWDLKEGESRAISLFNKAGLLERLSQSTVAFCQELSLGFLQPEDYSKSVPRGFFWLQSSGFTKNFNSELKQKAKLLLN